MRITICQLTNIGGILPEEWDALAHHVAEEESDLLLLPEMPFSRWLAADFTVVREQWDDAVAEAEEWLGLLPDLSPTRVAGTRPCAPDGRSLNRGFVVGDDGVRDVHDKHYLPNESGFWERRWYEPAEASFAAFDVAGARAGMLICTEMWFFEHARSLGRDGVDLLLVPRATPHESLDLWLAAGRSAAVTAGAFCVSSNLYRGRGGPADLGGLGWVIDPDGEVLAVTDQAEPFATVEVDLAEAIAAKDTYPRYVTGVHGRPEA